MRKTNQEGGVDTFRSCGTNQHLPLNGVVENWKYVFNCQIHAFM